ncbi:4Fe-4S binding protein [Acetivibrio straminisolvens]|uniref:Energy-conserving hydrogenase n=2 Tax=Acetivibrio straminisolvens TaxID=253314 RepID=W4V4S7_9FIRM|nr:4Fe-4S binding protein [Acetivibrio straminisolvens]GAE88410.1 energy-conserving hydrogenase [Acetivibrio straminisolvens JCM 21531]
MSFFTMTKTLIKSIFHGPYTVQYPLEKKGSFPASRGRIEINIEDCIFCGLCARRCPSNAINVVKAESLWSINRLRCIQCSYCSEVCPKKCLKMNNIYTAPSFENVEDEYRNARVSDNKENNRNIAGAC